MDHGSDGGARPLGRRARGVLQIAAAAMGVGMAIVVASDGSLGWSTLRVLIVGAVAASLVVAVRRGSRRSAAALSAAVGGVAAPASLTIAVRYLTMTGISVKAIGGVIAGGASVTLAGVGGLALVSSLRRWRRLWALPIVPVFAYAVTLPIFAAVFVTNVPRPDLDAQSPADRGLAYEDAVFVTGDGVELSGWYLPSTNGAAVALLHGASSTRSNVLGHAVVLARNGYGVLLFDARGHGRSDGRAMDFGWYGDQDISAAIDFLMARRDVDPGRIGAVGMSMGGEEAVGAVAADDRLRAVVGEGVTGRVARDHAWLSDAFGVRGLVAEGVHRFTTALADLLTDAGQPRTLRDAVVASSTPVLLIVAGTVDDESHAASYLRRASPETIEVWVVPGAGHTGGLRIAPGEWERRVSAFLDRMLLGTGG